MNYGKVDPDYAEYLHKEYEESFSDFVELREFLSAEFDTCAEPEKEAIETFETIRNAVEAYAAYIEANY